MTLDNSDAFGRKVMFSDRLCSSELSALCLVCTDAGGTADTTPATQSGRLVVTEPLSSLAWDIEAGQNA